MRSAVLTGPRQVEVALTEDPGCPPDGVVVRVLGVGLCGTDCAVVAGTRAVPRLPWVLGHEGVGEVVEVGAEVVDRAVGQRVAIEPNYCCLRCRACRRGRTSACADRMAVGLHVPGLLAEFAAVPARFAHPVADHVTLPDLVCTEPLTVARAAVRRAGIAPDDRCLVVGAGALGLFTCQVLVGLGAVPVVREPNPERLDLAVSLGARPDEADAAAVNHVVETSGVPDALRSSLDRLAPGGLATLVGISEAPSGITTETLVHRQLTLAGSLIYDHPGDFADTIVQLERGALAPSHVLGAEYAPADVAAAFAAVGTTPGKTWIRAAGGW